MSLSFYIHGCALHNRSLMYAVRFQDVCSEKYVGIALIMLELSRYIAFYFLVSENKVLCHPASVDSLTTSAGTEDHVSMGGFAARKCCTVVEHVEQGKKSTCIAWVFT